MATTHTPPAQHTRFINPNVSPIVPHHHRPQHPSRIRFLLDLSQCLTNFVQQLLPTAEELAVKEDVRKLLERLIRTAQPNSRLLSFGSQANGFSLKNSGEHELDIAYQIRAPKSFVCLTQCSRDRCP